MGTPDLFHLALQPADTFLILASDGMSDVMSDADVLVILGKAAAIAAPPPSLAQALVTASAAAWMHRFPGHARDDITVQVIHLKPPPPTST